MPPHGASSERRLALSMFVMLAVVEALLVGISPLLPAYEIRLSLSGLEVSALLAATSLALLLAGIPAGLVAERIGARRMTLIAGAVLCLASFAEADPFSYAYLLLDRVVIGAATGVLWTSGLAWLADLPEGRVSAVGIGMTMAGVGLVMGPGVIGLIAQAFGLGAPFILISAVIGLLNLLLARTAHRPAVGAHDVGPPSLSGVLAAAGRRPDLRSALVALCASAVAAGALSVIVPLELHRDGASTGTIGLILFLTGLGYIAASTVVARIGARIVNSRAVVITSAAAGIFLLPGSLSRSAAALILAMALVTPFRGALATLCYQLGASAAGDGVGAASVIGVLNSVWGAVSVLAPLGAGAIFDAAGGRTAFVCTQAVVLVAAAAAALSHRRSLVPAPVG